jgi:sugar phosphate isomerase/epimerase
MIEMQFIEGGRRSMEKIALQLYSIKELTEKDFLGTLKKVAEVGYAGVEFAGFFNTPARELRKVLDDLNLKAAGSHAGPDALKADLEALIEYALEIGNPYLIAPWMPEEMRNSADAYKRTGELFNQIGSKCKENGLKFGYHNHEFEFEKFGGEYGLDLLVANTQPDHLFIELDTFWVEYSGLKSVDFINKYKERCAILHIKEMMSLEQKVNTEIGKGIMDFKGITAAGKKYGAEWYTVEQEEFEIDQLQSIRESYGYLKGIL